MPDTAFTVEITYVPLFLDPGLYAAVVLPDEIDEDPPPSASMPAYGEAWLRLATIAAERALYPGQRWSEPGADDAPESHDLGNPVG
jgi:hypothetical protein